MNMQHNETLGILTTMPSSERKLGPYVVLKKRANGRAAAYFLVPKRLRPSGWSPAIPLCRDLDLADDVDALTNEQFARLMLAGAKIYAEFKVARHGTEGKPPAKSLQTAISTWKKSSRWAATSPKTREGYGYSIQKIQIWSDACGHPDPSTIRAPMIEKMLARYDDRPTTKRQLLKALSMVMDHVVALGWRTDNPCNSISVSVPRTKAEIWEQADVDAYVKAARDTGVESIALIILLEWELGQRLTDVRQFRPGVEYDSTLGVFSFRQQKTYAPVVIEISPTLREMLAVAGEGQLFLFRNERTGKAYTENRLSQTFKWVRTAAVKAGARPLVLRQLRHSCVVQLARAGCTVPEIAAITGHALGSVHSILGTYLPRDGTVARNAQIKRGIVVEKVG